MIDRYTRVVLTIIAINLTIIVAHGVGELFFPEAWAQQTVPVYVQGGQLDYETDISSGPTLKVCTDC